MNVQNAVQSAGKRWGLFPPGSMLVVGVSGGADSLALLHALAALRKRLRITLHAATLDHGLRGPAGADDAAYVVALAARWNVPVTAGAVEAAALAAQWQMGVEEAARRARYAFLAEVARAHEAGRVAVAHHAGDQAETVLMHLLRGAGVTGLGGMRAISPLPGAPELALLRPLLGVTRAQIDAYCVQHKIVPRTDVSNADPTYTRNWLRHTALPLLETRFPGAARALAHLAESAALDDALLDDLLAALLADARTSGDQVRLARARFRGAHPALQRRFVRWAAGRMAPGAELSHERTEAAVQVFLTGQRGQRVELPGSVWATVDGHWVLVTRRPER